jgi:hypothetical protein
LTNANPYAAIVVVFVIVVEAKILKRHNKLSLNPRRDLRKERLIAILHNSKCTISV